MFKGHITSIHITAESGATPQVTGKTVEGEVREKSETKA